MESQSSVYRTVVQPEWIDHNGHMNVAYFVVAFDQATDATYEAWGIGQDYPNHTDCSVFTLGMNVDYLGELFEGNEIAIETILVDQDSKRIHYFHQMYQCGTEKLVATNECLCMNVNLTTRKSHPFPDTIQTKLESALSKNVQPKGFGRTLKIRR